MILWMRRGTAVLNGIVLMALLFPNGSRWAVMAGGILNFAWAMAEKFPPSLRFFFGPTALVINTFLSAYGVLIGGSSAWAVLVAGLSLFSWNAGLFGGRWGEAPRSTQSRYLKRVGVMVALGLGAGLSAAAWQGKTSLPFSLTFLAMLAAGIPLLRLLSQASPKG